MKYKELFYDTPIEGLDVRDILRKGSTTRDNFNYDRLQESVPLYSLFSMDEINALYKIATSIRYAGNKRKKLDEIAKIMKPKGFSRLAGGTNRVVYYHPDIPDMIWKIATDDTGLNDNPSEMYNQNFIKPYCCKVFSCHPSGVIASLERVERFVNYYEFECNRDCIFEIITKILIGKYVLEDFGIDYFMNWGIRVGFGPVILDFPYIYELDGSKLKCGLRLEDGTICNGEIDYTPGFNKLVCTKCGAEHRARELGSKLKDSSMDLERKGKTMKITIMRGDEIVRTSYQKDTVEYLGRAAKAKSWKNKTKSNDPVESSYMINKSPQITITRGNKMVNVDDTPRTVYQDIEKKRDITVSVVRRTTEDRVDEIKREESKNDIRISNIPDGYVRDIKNGRVVGYTSLDGGEYIPLEAYEKIKERNAKTEELKKKAIATQSIKPSSAVPKTPIEVIRAESEKAYTNDNGDILDHIVGKRVLDIVTDTVSYRETVMINKVEEEDIKEEEPVVEDKAQEEFTGNEHIEFDVEALQKAMRDNIGITKEEIDNINNTMDDNIHNDNQEEKSIEESDDDKEEENTPIQSFEYHDEDKVEQEEPKEEVVVVEAQKEEPSPAPAPTPIRARGGKMSLSDIMSNY